MREPLRPLSITDEELKKMSDEALADLEDRLLLDSELDLSKDSQFTSGRVVVWVLSIIGIVLLLSLMSRLPTQKLGPLNIPLYLIALGAGAGGAHYLWSAVGRRTREGVRWLLGYWPLMLYLAGQIYHFTHRG